MSIAIEDLLGVGQSEAVNIARLHRKSFPGISTDTRAMHPGCLFLALRGERHDGHAFVREAFAKGAACAVVDDRADRSTYEAMPALIVKDTATALGELARLHRRRFRIPVLAIGGSNGKTTTKELVNAVLKTTYRVHATQANQNNHIGVPLTLLGIKKGHEIAVIEVGTNHFGELRYLASLVEPTNALLTNIGHEHLEFFGSLDGVEKEEGELFAALGAKGSAFVNVDDTRVIAQAARARKKIRFGFSSGAAIRGTIVSYTADGRAECTVATAGKKKFSLIPSLPGEQHAANALAAAAVGLTFSVPVRLIQGAVKKFRAVDKRMAIVKTAGVTIINDTYNANGDSVISALAALKNMSCRGKKVVLLGEMLELGAAAEAEHRRVGAAIAAMGFEYVLTVGPLARFVNEAAGRRAMNFHYDQKNQLAEYALELLAAGDVVLVKGSRGSRMEDVVTFLQERIVRKTS